MHKSAVECAISSKKGMHSVKKTNESCKFWRNKKILSAIHSDKYFFRKEMSVCSLQSTKAIQTVMRTPKTKSMRINVNSSYSFVFLILATNPSRNPID